MENQVKVISSELMSKKIVNCFGGNRIEINYIITTETNNRINKYDVVFEVRIVDYNDVYMAVYSVNALTNNEETLTDEAITSILEE